MAVFELILCIIAAVVVSSFASRFVPKVSTPLVQIVLGVLVTYLPFFPDAKLDPELFMVLFIAPLLYLAIGGVPLAMCYKAINTLDSMVGYKNDRYLYFGRASAKLDDIVNWIPARLAGLLTVLCAFLVGLDGKNAWKIYRRDCHNHASPNSAQTESACAGALQVQLAGDAYYFGKLCHKPTIGDPIRPVKPQDIVLANRLMVASDLVFAALCCAAWAMVYWLI